MKREIVEVGGYMTMSEIPKTEMLQHEPWVATSYGAEQRRAVYVGGQENEQWRSTLIGRADTD